MLVEDRATGPDVDKLDALAIVNTHLATASAYRTSKMMNAQLSGLPKYLTPIGGGSNGLNSLQKTVAYLHGEVRLKATPASLDALPVSETVEDRATGPDVDRLDALLRSDGLLASVTDAVGGEGAWPFSRGL